MEDVAIGWVVGNWLLSLERVWWDVRDGSEWSWVGLTQEWLASSCGRKGVQLRCGLEVVWCSGCSDNSGVGGDTWSDQASNWQWGEVTDAGSGGLTRLDGSSIDNSRESDNGEGGLHFGDVIVDEQGNTLQLHSGSR